MKKILLTLAAATLCSTAFSAVGDKTVILDQKFEEGTVLANSTTYAWGEEIQGMITANGLYMTNKSNKENNYENVNFLSFRSVIGNATHELGFSYEVYSPKDKGQNNTYYTMNYFNGNGDFVFGVQEASGGWAYTANIITANADGSTSTVALPKGHMSKGGGSVVDFTVTFSGESAIVAIDGASYTAYTANLGIKSIKLSVTGENGFDRDMYVKNFVITSTEVEAAQFADYTVNYVCGDKVLKSEKKKGVVNSAISISADDMNALTIDDVKYIYVSNDAEGKTVDAEGTTVVTVTFREAALYNYTIKNNVNDDVKTGSCYEGESVTEAYSRYILAEDGIVWEKFPGKNVPYTVTFTPEADNYVETFEYAATEISDGVYFVEGEDIEGMEVVTRDNANARCSNAAGGYAPGVVEICKLQAGTYKVTMGVWGNGGATFIVKAGEKTVLTAATAGYWLDATSEEFTLDTETALTFEGSATNKPLDYILITGNGATSAVNAIEATNADGKWYNLQGVQIAAPTQAGLYIHNGKKIIVK
ncbi:MAG: hypothetical protein K2N25_06610 [Muribaculaceae bacterium]|nr:hypothetical protein [Muribaculaceae bacterium]